MPDPRLWFNAFYVLFARNEVLGLLVVLVFSLLAASLFSRRGEGTSAAPQLFGTITNDHLLLGGIAVFAFAIAALVPISCLMSLP